MCKKIIDENQYKLCIKKATGELVPEFWFAMLDEISGIGPTRRKALMRYFQSIDDIRNASRQCGGRLHIVFGMVDDKDVRGVLALLPREADYYFTQADTHRAIPSVTLADMAKESGLQGIAYPTVKDAYNAALTAATPDDFIFVGGSSYVVADFLS